MSDVDLLHGMGRVSGEFRRRYHVEVEKSSYSGLQGNGKILYMLEHWGEMSQKELAGRLGIRPQSLTAALLKLEQAGYISRRRSEKDKREQFVSITELGYERGREMRRIRERVVGEMFGCLSSEEKEVLSSLLGRIIDRFQEAQEEERKE